MGAAETEALARRRRTQMIAFAIVSLIIGAVLLAISSPRKGGDFKVGAKDVETTLPEITGPAKIPAFILGLVLIGIGLWMGILLFLESLEVDDKKIAENPQVEATQITGVEHSSETPPIISKSSSTPPAQQTISSSGNCAIGTPLPHRVPVVGQPWTLPDGGWIIVNFWSNEPGIDQTEHKLLLKPDDPRAFLGGGSAWQWTDECESVARENYRNNPLPLITLEEVRGQNLMR